jgi:hypothetical protein
MGKKKVTVDDGDQLEFKALLKAKAYIFILSCIGFYSLLMAVLWPLARMLRRDK